jgi:hypothetical protein
MKNIYLLRSAVVIIIALFFVGCGTPKVSVVVLPCEAETVSDSLYIRELGHGISSHLQFARNEALLDAQFKLVNRLCDSIRMYMPQVNSIGDSILVGYKDTILFRYPLSYFGELSYTRKECEKVTYDANNQYHCFITLSIPKKDIEHASDKVFFDFLNYIVQFTH